MNMKKFNWTAVLIFSGIALAYTFPIYKNIFYWGHMDWDQFTFWHAVPREIILRYKQFPLWNPYANGGNVLLAHPQSAFLSPFFVFVLLGGPVIGLKLEIFAHLLVGLLGMHALARYLGLNRHCSYFSAVIYMLSAVFPLHLGEGQAEWLALSFVPWLFLFYSQSLGVDIPSLSGQDAVLPGNPARQPLLAGCSAPFLGGTVTLCVILISGVYVVTFFMVFLTVYAGLKSVQLRHIRPLSTLALMLAGASLLGAVKFLPMLEFIRQVPRLIDQRSGVDFGTLWTMFFGREQAFLDRQLWETTLTNAGTYQYGWHEYGAYIGLLPFFLFVVGAIKYFKKYWPLIGAAIICLLLVLGDSSPVNLWRFLHHFPVYGSLTVPSRFIFCFIFPVAILAGFGLAGLELRFPPRGWILSSLILLFVTFDLWQVNSVLFKDVFIIPPVLVSRAPVFRQRYSSVNFYKEKALSRSSQYPIFLENSGILDAYECSAVQRGDVRVEADPYYRGELYFSKPAGKILNVSFSPNKIAADVNVTRADMLILNQNYYTGWRVKADGKSIRPVVYKGLLAAQLQPGRHRVVFYYMPFSFLLGLGLSLTAIGMMAARFVMQGRKPGPAGDEAGANKHPGMTEAG